MFNIISLQVAPLGGGGGGGVSKQKGVVGYILIKTFPRICFHIPIYVMCASTCSLRDQE